MLQVQPKLKEELDGKAASSSNVRPLAPKEGAGANGMSAPRLVNSQPTDPRRSNQPLYATPAIPDRTQTRVPAIIGEASFRGTIAADGIIGGQPGTNGSLSLKQYGRTFYGTEPELTGEITFVDMLRVNGYIAGSVFSKKGTLIVDAAGRVDANVEVAVAVIGGTVTGDIVAHERVEVGPSAKIYGNIWTRSLAIQNGALFEGVCQMLEAKVDGS
jgi:cytoskeletal protein CcmA (bactofilin family)